MTIGSKHRATHADFQRAWDHVEDYVSRDDARESVRAAAREIQDTMKTGWRVAMAWSGGKDSQALRVVCDEAGIEDSVISLAPYLEFPAFLAWLDREQWPQLERQERRDMTVRWLGDHEDLIFPTAKRGYWWVEQTTHWGQQAYYEAQGLDCIVLGRRKLDDNFIGTDGMHVNKRGVRQFCPLRDWSHEMVLAVIRYYGMNLPPNYAWSEGWTKGTGVWPGRDRSVEKAVGYARTWRIDPTVVRDAARQVQSARDFIEQYVNGDRPMPII